MSLGWYLNDVAALLKDQSFLFTSQNQMTRFVNESRRQLAQRSGCIRRLVSGKSAFGASAQPGAFIPGAAQPGALPGAQPNASANGYASQNTLQTIPGVERYPYQGFWNPYASAQHAGVEGIIDVADLSINWVGSVRPMMVWMPFDDFQAYCRAYATLTTSFPCAWAVMDDGEFGEIWLFPPPSMPCEMEADCFCVPKPLYNDNDFDAIPPGLRNSIKFMAASLAYMSSQRFAQADYMEQQFLQRIGTAAVASNRSKQPNYYYSNFN